MKRGLCVIVLSAVLAAACGCAGPRGTELSKRLIVEAIGVDRTEGSYTVTLQALDAYHAGDGKAQNGEDKPTRICTFTGDSVAEALSRVPAATGLTPLYTQARLLLIGRPLAEEGIGDALDYFLREYHTRSDILIAAAEKDAAEIVTADLGTAAPDAQILEEALLRGNENGECCAVKLFRFMNLLFSGTDTAYCPLVGLQDGPEDGQKDPRLGTTAFFEDARLIFTADGNLTKGLLFLTDGIGHTTLGVRGTLGAYTMETAFADTKIRFLRREDGGVKAKITVQVAADITEFTLKSARGVGEAETLDAQEAGRKHLETLLNGSLSYYYGAHKADVCRLMRRVCLRLPKEKTAFCETLFSQKAGTVETEVDFTVRRTGKESLEK